MSHAIRVVSTRVLPEPAPAKIKACSAGKVTALSCSALSPAIKGLSSPVGINAAGARANAGATELGVAEATDEGEGWSCMAQF
jgi:hypothetical protein